MSNTKLQFFFLFSLVIVFVVGSFGRVTVFVEDVSTNTNVREEEEEEEFEFHYDHKNQIENVVSSSSSSSSKLSMLPTLTLHNNNNMAKIDEDDDSSSTRILRRRNKKRKSKKKNKTKNKSKSKKDESTTKGSNTEKPMSKSEKSSKQQQQQASKKKRGSFRSKGSTTTTTTTSSSSKSTTVKREKKEKKKEKKKKQHLMKQPKGFTSPMPTPYDSDDVDPTPTIVTTPPSPISVSPPPPPPPFATQPDRDVFPSPVPTAIPSTEPSSSMEEIVLPSLSPTTSSPLSVSPSSKPSTSMMDPSPPPSSSPTTTTGGGGGGQETAYCPIEDRIILGNSGDGGLYSNNFLFCSGTFIAAIDDNVIEIVVNPITNQLWAQTGRGSFTMYEMNPITGEEIMNTRFSTEPVNQFHALEYVNGTLYGGGWQKLDGTAYAGSSLYRITPEAGTWEEIGPTGVRPLTGLAWTGTTLYGTSGAGWPPAELYEINIETGIAEVVCSEMSQGFGSLVYYPDTGTLYGGTPDGFIAEIDPISCSTKNTNGNENWWSAGYRPLTGLTMICSDGDF